MPQISLNDMTRVPNYQTMRVKGHVKKQALHLLVDYGSTHNFLDLHAARRLGCNMSKTCPLQVSVANGQVMSIIYECKNFKWSIQGQEFETDVMILPLGRCEMVLGIQWLATLGTIQFDFKNLVMDFVVNGKRFTLMQMSGVNTRPNPAIQTLLREFAPVFNTPKELPPNRSHDHTIPLFPNTPPINIRPYKHPLNQKEKDGNWRMCVDYKMLNKYTMKDKFPILVIEELLDELHRAKVFSKLDLRSGYHQIRMNKDDIHKTTFRTHEGHYEFLVMPFGLTNAPSTFQSLMNTIFKTYLRKFVLVFFNDILMYSKNKEDHWKHLRIILETMLQHTLFAKESKCTFAASQVEYLGHIINAKGVATDPAKIQAMKSWPTPQTVKQLRGFLGLIGYYRKFIKNYAWISKPLTNLLKNDAFVWINEAQEAFMTLKQAIIQTPVLALPDFQKTFVGETDASGKIIQQLREGTSANNKYQWEGNILKRKGKLVVGSDEQLRATIVQHYYADAVGGHSRINVIDHRVRSLFYWKGLHKTVKKYVRECDVCQRNKADLAAYPGLLQPLPIPERIWSDISMDFIVGLPRSQEKTVIFVVVDRLSKYAHFVALCHPYTASSVAQAFLDSIYKLHGLPDSLWTNRSCQQVLGMLFEVYDRGNTKRVAVYGQTPPLHNPYVAVESAVESVDRSLHARERAIEMLQFHIKRAQDRMKKYADLKRSEREFEVGMWVYLKLQPHKQVTIRQEAQNKLSPKYYGPFMIVEKIGVVAYKLELPNLKNPSIRNWKASTTRQHVYGTMKWINHGEEIAGMEIAEDLIKRKNGDDAKVKTTFNTLLTYTKNVATKPEEEKFHKIRLSNTAFQGLKTGMYYLRSRVAADAIKFTVDTSILKKTQRLTKVCAGGYIAIAIDLSLMEAYSQKVQPEQTTSGLENATMVKFVLTFVHSFSTKSSKNAVSLYLERARLIDRIRVSLRSSSSDSLVTILNDPALDSFVVANSLKSAPSPDSALSLIETLKKIPHFTHNQNTLYALAKILGKSGDTRKLKALVNGINSGKFKNVARVSFMDQMKLYAPAGDLESVLCVWHEWRVVKGPNVESYNIIMGICAQTGKDYEAVKTFSRMIDEGGIPNSRTYTVIIEHLLRSGNLDPAMEVFSMLPPMGVKHTLRQYSVLVDAFCGADRFDMAKSLLSEMQMDGIFPNRGMLSSLQRMHDARFVEETLELIKEMLPDSRIENVKLASDDYHDDNDGDGGFECTHDDAKVNGIKLKPWFDPTILASSLRFWRPEEVSTLDDAKLVWTTRLVSKMIRSFSSAESAWEFFCWVVNQPGFSHDVQTVSKMITKLAQEGRVNLIEQLISMIKSEGIQLSYTTVKVVIDYYGVSKNGEAAVKVFQNVKTLCGTLSKHYLLSLYTSLLKTLAKCKMDSKALDTLDEMILSGILPEIQTFSGLMHHFAREGNIKTVQRLFGMVKQSGLEPDAYMFKVLICAYCNSSRAALALRAFEDMKTYNLSPDDSTKRLLVKSLWNEGKLREAAAVEESSVLTNDESMVALRGILCSTNATDLQRVYSVYSSCFPSINDNKDPCEGSSISL
ncbi:pentatricopeptide repeat-containing protein [Tanacetum coccineum]|uniref:Pentatricopeptide repeat-containing protein n=1 Tax=Tanacetum coccineum TaxID=301880 RepID=A0ABQ5HAI5_9ASTR